MSKGLHFTTAAAKTFYMIFPSTRYIRELNVKPRKKYGQNFLIDKNIAAKVSASAAILPGDTVIEIGPGLGSITLFLLQKTDSVICFEIDTNLFNILTASLEKDSHACIINQDILSVCFSDYAASDKVILTGSIPYALSTQLLFKILDESSCITRAVFIVQREVAQRFCSRPGSKDYGVPTVYCHAYLKTLIHFTIPPECFYPRPNVHSALLELAPLKDKQFNSEKEIFFRTIVRHSFSQRRKKLFNCLKGFIKQHTPHPDLLKICARDAGIDLDRRAESLSVDEFYALSSHIQQNLS